MQLNGWSFPADASFITGAEVFVDGGTLRPRPGDGQRGGPGDRRSNRRSAADAEASARAARARRSYDSVMERTPYTTTVGTHMA